MSILKVQRIEGINPGEAVQVLGAKGIALPRGSSAQKPTQVPAGTLWFNTDSQTLELYNGSAWIDVSVVSGDPALQVAPPLVGRGTAAQPLDMSLSQFATASGCLSQVYIAPNGKLRGRGTPADPLGVDIGSIDVQGGLTRVHTDSTLTGEGTPRSPLGINLQSVRAEKQVYPLVSLIANTSLSDQHKAKHLRFALANLVLSILNQPAFAAGDIALVSNASSGSCEITGLAYPLSTLRLAPGESTWLVGLGQGVAAVGLPLSEVQRRRVRSVSGQIDLQPRDFGSIVVATGSSARIRLPQMTPPTGVVAVIVNAAEGGVEVRGSNNEALGYIDRGYYAQILYDGSTYTLLSNQTQARHWHNGFANVVNLPASGNRTIQADDAGKLLRWSYNTSSILQLQLPSPSPLVRGQAFAVEVGPLSVNRNTENWGVQVRDSTGQIVGEVPVKLERSTSGVRRTVSYVGVFISDGESLLKL